VAWWFFPDGYLKQAYEHVRAAGGVCIADEVQAGFGRTGTNFWGLKLRAWFPTLSRWPRASATVAAGRRGDDRENADTVTRRIHFNTFGGNPVVCAQGKAVLEVIEKEKLQANSLKLGAHILAGLEKLKERHNIIATCAGRD